MTPKMLIATLMAVVLLGGVLRRVPAQAPFDSAAFAFRCGQMGQTCLDHRVMLVRSGDVRIDRSDSVSVHLRFADTTITRLLLEFSAVGIDSLPDRIPMTNAEFSVCTTHWTGVIVDLFRDGVHRRVEDRRGCHVDEDKFGVERSRRLQLLQRFEDSLRWSLGVEKHVEPRTAAGLLTTVRALASNEPWLRGIPGIPDTAIVYREFIRRGADGRDSVMIGNKAIYYPEMKYIQGDSAIVEIHVRGPGHAARTGLPFVDNSGSGTWWFAYVNGAWVVTRATVITS